MRTVLIVAAVLGVMGCATQVAWGKSTVPVSVHGVNYSNEEFSYVVEDPNDPKNKAGGEIVNRFAAGGTMCCYELPKQWRAGIQLKVNSTHWLQKQADGKIPEVKQSFVVEVPPYVDGKPGELWVLRDADGSIKVVSSDYQPDHEKWPGVVKGWPTPSAEYKRERWALYLKLAQSDVNSGKRLLAKLESDPAKAAKDAWEVMSKYEPKEVAGFNGFNDPKFVIWLKQRYEESLRISEKRLESVMESRP